MKSLKEGAIEDVVHVIKRWHSPFPCKIDLFLKSGLRYQSSHLIFKVKVDERFDGHLGFQAKNDLWFGKEFLTLLTFGKFLMTAESGIFGN
jgi:hypothetical protein